MIKHCRTCPKSVDEKELVTIESCILEGSQLKKQYKRSGELQEKVCPECAKKLAQGIDP